MSALDIVLCSCDGGPYSGARKSGTPWFCKRCGFMVREQYVAIVQRAANAALNVAADIVRARRT